MMSLEERISAFARLGERINQITAEEKDNLFLHAKNENAWFTDESIRLALNGISKFITEHTLVDWTSRYRLQNHTPKKVGVAMAGNIPLVGFHDFMCILISGHRVIAKLSSQDSVLIQFLAKELISIEPRMADLIKFEEQLKGVDAMIATGSDNTARYFEYYFRNIPSIIRKNRSSCAILLGAEPKDELVLLGKDVFSYFGLGCRNVSKLFVAEEFDFIPLLDSWSTYTEKINHHKFANNYDYQKSILLVNSVPFLDSGFILLTESTSLVSPISVLFYERFKDQDDLHKKIALHEGKIQCITSAKGWFNDSIPFGEAQFPEVWDYADNVDTMKFLEAL
jgi:Acyl-CoA reductase (LuxC)